MPIKLKTPDVAGLDEAAQVMRAWQVEGAPVQLHPGDLGWSRRFGAETTAAAVRTWSRDGRILAVGLLDEPALLRLAIAPEADDDAELARQLIDDVTQAERGVLPSGDVAVEARFGAALRGLLHGNGWTDDEPWSPLRHDLAGALEPHGVRIEVIGPERAEVRAALQRAAFQRSTFTADGWHTMAAGPAYADARCLIAYDDHDVAVATVTVWSAGPGRAGLLEPMGVHHDHRGHGYGTAISIAAAAALRDLGSSSAVVCTPSSNVGAVATYRAAGFSESPQVRDLRRAGSKNE